jgi:hypothetical protein
MFHDPADTVQTSTVPVLLIDSAPIITIEPVASVARPAKLRDDDAVSQDRLSERFMAWVTGLGAMGIYCSALIHFITIGIVILILWSLDLLMLPESIQEINAVRASLSDREIEDLNVDMAEFPSLRVELPGGSDEDRVMTPADFVKNAENDINIAELSLAAGVGDGTSAGDGDGNGFVFKMPEDGRAVTKGSFTAWTEPKSPIEGDPYQIIVEIRVPKNIRRYRSSDLSGFVRGTDGWEQKLPIDPKLPFATWSSRGGKTFVLRRNTYLPLVSQKAQLIINVPGAQRLVRDTIAIESRILKEKQKLELVFAPPENEDE